VTDEEEKDKADEPKEQKTKTVTKTVWDWETLNEIKAIWMREKADITEREYNDFYKSISKDT
jgi:heat shock protein beta